MTVPGTVINCQDPARQCDNDFLVLARGYTVPSAIDINNIISDRILDSVHWIWMRPGLHGREAH